MYSRTRKVAALSQSAAQHICASESWTRGTGASAVYAGLASLKSLKMFFTFDFCASHESDTPPAPINASGALIDVRIPEFRKSCAWGKCKHSLSEGRSHN